MPLIVLSTTKFVNKCKTIQINDENKNKVNTLNIFFFKNNFKYISIFLF
jgi:hypothetical protein